MLTGSLLFFLLEWVVRVGMLFVITGRRRRDPTADMAWLAVTFFQPFLGLTAFLLFGGNRISRGRAERRAALLKTLNRQDGRVTEMALTLLDFRHREVSELAKRLGGMPLVGGNSGRFMSSTSEVIDALIADIERARHHVHLQFYIWGVDATARRVMQALVEAERRGVQCRVMVDAVGSRGMLRRLARPMREAGIEVVAMLPVGIFRSLVARMDLRNHRKIAVIDGRIGYTGSQNIVDADYGKGGLVWHDLMMRAEGPVVRELQTVFLSDWFLETGSLPEDDNFFPVEADAPGVLAMQTLPSGPSYTTENYQRMILHALHTAQSEVVITTPYFIPDEAFLQAMEVAILRGVRVRLAVPEKSDQILVGNASRAYYDQLLEIGVEILLYQGGLLHAKTMRVDSGFAFFGSSNFDIRSFQLNEELTIVLYGAEGVESLRQQQEAYLCQTRRLEPSEWAKRSVSERILQNLTKLFSPLL